jgi:hypothetical protein
MDQAPRPIISVINGAAGSAQRNKKDRRCQDESETGQDAWFGFHN